MKKPRFLIAPDSFKESLSAMQAACAIEKGLLAVFPAAETRCLPLADGGEGTVQALCEAKNGRIEKIGVHGPLMRKIRAFFGIIPPKTAVIEMATASGLELLSGKERNPAKTTTYGTGELIKAALDKGCRKIIIGIGGSATNDAGAGMAQALGARLLDEQGKNIGKGGAALSDLHKIELSGIDSRLSETEILVACDVSNPLFGQQGAAYTYARQKGANAEMVASLDKNLQNFARVVQRDLDIKISKTPGGGAAGGLGAGLIAFAGAKLKPGFEIVSQLVELEEAIKNTDFVCTGEGKIDFQTRFGKTPYGVAQLAKKHHKPVLAFAGTLGENTENLYQDGFSCLIPIAEKPAALPEALKKAELWLENAARRSAKLLQIGIAQIDNFL